MRIWVGPLVLLALWAGCQKSGNRENEQTERAPDVGEVAVALPNKLASPEAVGAVSPTPPDATSKVFYLNKSPLFYSETGNGNDRGLLVHEYFRQALLLAAREELGLVTRDAWLGDAIPADGPVRPFEIATRVGVATRLEVARGFSPAMSVVGSVEMPPYSHAGYNKRLYSAAESFSRTSFLEILKNQYGDRRRPAWKAEATVPAEIEESLRRMSFLGQFRAVRQLHERMAAEGASPAMLGALVRGYANLGVLTESHWHPAHKVFKARAILYAQRWLAREPESAAAMWHRAYALTLTGLHVDAMADLETAQKAWQALPEKGRPPRPGWVPLLDACCHYDVEKLAAELGHAEHGQLAALLHYHTVELAGNQRWAMQTGLATVEKIPECYRVHDGVCHFAGVTAPAGDATLAPFRILARTLYEQVKAMPGLPKTASQEAKRPAGRSGIAVASFGSGDGESDVASELMARAHLIAALREASKPPSAATPNAGTAAGNRNAASPADAGEPSWAALAQLIEDASFLHVWRRAYYVRYTSSGDSVRGILQQAAPLVADHPLRLFLETLEGNATKRRAALAEAERLLPDGMELHAFILRTGYRDARPEAAYPHLLSMLAHADDIARDFVVQCRLYAAKPDALGRYAKFLREISPHSPLARAFLLDAGEADTSQIVEWKKAAHKYPALADSLARHYARAKQWDDAIRCGQMAIKMVSGREIYEFVSDAYLEKNDENGWLKTLEGALQRPDYGQDHAEINGIIAGHFMDKREWRRAEPYAKAAAQSNLENGLWCAARCYEGLQQWETAEQYFKAMANRYPWSHAAVRWHCFCRRTGKGDLQAARELARRYLENSSAHTASDVRYTAAMFHLLEKEDEQALAIYRDSFAKEAEPFCGLWVALLADERKDPKSRDAALTRVRTHGPFVVRKDVARMRKEMIQLAAWIEGDLTQGGKGEIDDKAVKELLVPIQGTFEASYVEMFLARYLQSHGKPEAAIPHWKACAAADASTELPLCLAGAALLGLGVKVEDHAKLSRQDGKAAASSLPEAKRTDTNEKADKAPSKHGASNAGGKTASPPAGRKRQPESVKPDKAAEKKAEVKDAKP